MGTVLDLIGSYVVKAALIGIIISTSVTLNEVMVEKSQLVISEKNLNVAISVMEWDLRNIGYGTTPPTSSITYAHVYYLHFNADVDNNGTTDNVRWTYQYRTFESGVGYRYDLVRTVNGASYTAVRNLYYNPSATVTEDWVSWRFYYYDASGQVIPYDWEGKIPFAQLPNIRGVKVFMKTKSSVQVNNKYYIASRIFTVFPANLSL